MVNQVRIIAILMIVSGVLECLMGLLTAAMGPFLFAIMTQMPQQPGVQPPPTQVVGVMSGVYVVWGIVLLGVGILRLVAGIRNYKFRGKVLGIVAMSIGVLSVFSGCCMPTSIGLLIYGLIVYLNADVSRAFAMGDQGMSPEQIMAAFQRPMGPT